VTARNRRRYGGYIVHVGIAVLLIGVAASSTFQTNRDVRLLPGQSTRVGDYDIRYLKPTAEVANEKIAFGAVLDVKRDGRHYATLSPTRNFYRSQDPSQGPIGRFFAGESTSEVGLRAGLRNDFWTAIRPDLARLSKPIADANRRFESSPLDLQGLVIAAIADSYRKDPPPATFRFIVNPMVSWLWIGALIALVGALIGIWPSAEARRRRVTSAYAAKLGQELSRA
jgi:cytochrome c-type biogenesis protein CcmF